jgi:hypothetical protein
MRFWLEPVAATETGRPRSKPKAGSWALPLPPGYGWNELEPIEMGLDERVRDAARLSFESSRTWERPSGGYPSVGAAAKQLTRNQLA